MCVAFQDLAALYPSCLQDGRFLVDFYMAHPTNVLIMPSISTFGFIIVIRHQQYLAPWMHTLSLHPTHPKTMQNNTILSQIKHRQTSPTLTPTFMGLLSLSLYGDVRLMIKLAKRIGMPLPGENPCFQILYPASTFPHTPYMLTRVTT